MARATTDTTDTNPASTYGDPGTSPNTDGAPEADPGSVPVEAHVRSAPGTRARDTAVRRVTDLEAELMRLQLAIVQTDGEMKGAHLQAAREYIADVLEQVVEGKRRMPRELADHLAKGLAAKA
jgi:hypothetical protein